MSTTQTAVVEPTQSCPLTEFNCESTAKDPESSSERQLSETAVVGREPATPFLKLIVAGYSFFCAGVSDGTCKYHFIWTFTSFPLCPLPETTSPVMLKCIMVFTSPITCWKTTC